MRIEEEEELKLRSMWQRNHVRDGSIAKISTVK